MTIYLPFSLQRKGCEAENSGSGHRVYSEGTLPNPWFRDTLRGPEPSTGVTESSPLHLCRSTRGQLLLYTKRNRSLGWKKTPMNYTVGEG